MLNVFIVQTYDKYILFVLLQVSKDDKPWWSGTWTQSEVGIGEPSIVPKSLSEQRAPGEPFKFCFHSLGLEKIQNFVFSVDWSVLGVLNGHIFILGDLREPIVQLYNIKTIL